MERYELSLEGTLARLYSELEEEGGKREGGVKYDLG